MQSRAPVAMLMAVHAGADVGHFDEALASLQAQSHGDVRIFLYCDGPLTPAHDAVIASRLRLDSALDRVVREAERAGLPTGLNRLIDAALRDPSIRFLARMDADDICLPARIERQVEFLDAHPDVSVVGTWCIEFDRPGVPSFYKQLPTDAAAVREFMLYRSPLAHPTVMFRRSVLEAGYRYDPGLRIMQDYEFWSRLLADGHQISNVPEYLLWYRMADGFYARRTGFERAWGEVKLRWRYARQLGLLRPAHLLGLLALFLLRLSPEAVKRLAYARLR
jgi:hypothetical protein